MYKIIGADQKEYGPITADQIRQWLAQGRVNAQTRAKPADGGEWQTLADIPEFADAFYTEPPPTPEAPSPAMATGSAGRPRTSGMAVTSLVLGVLGFFTCGLTAVVGLVLGIVAMNKVRKSNGALTGQGIAIAGTVTSALFLAMIPILVAMMLPAVAKAKARAQTITCVNHMKQLSLSARLYAEGHDRRFPPAATWCDAMKDAGASEQVFLCPAGDAASRCNYAFNEQLDGIEVSKVDPETVLFFETDGGWNKHGGVALMQGISRHGGPLVVAFADGSVQQVKATELSKLRWNP